MSRINQTTFKENGYKRLACPNCGRFIGETNLKDKDPWEKKCVKCKTVITVYPPRYGTKNNKIGIYWHSQSDSCWTAI